MSAGRSNFSWRRSSRSAPVARARVAMIWSLLWLLPSLPARAQISTPIELGSNQADGASTASLAITTTASAPAGASVIVLAVDVASVGIPATSAACSDGANNTYTTDVFYAFASICATHQIALALPSGSTIKVTWSGQSGQQSYRVHAFAVTGLANTPLDKTASNFDYTSTSSPTSGAVTITQANELLVGAIMDQSESATQAGFSAGSGYTALTAVGAMAPSLFGEYHIVSATGTYAATGSLTTAMVQPWVTLLATYKAAPFSPPDLATPPDLSASLDLSTPPDLTTAPNLSVGSGGGACGCHVGGYTEAPWWLSLAIVVAMLGLILRRPSKS